MNFDLLQNFFRFAIYNEAKQKFLRSIYHLPVN